MRGVEVVKREALRPLCGSRRHLDSKRVEEIYETSIDKTAQK